jgi:hypothetical protein
MLDLLGQTIKRSSALVGILFLARAASAQLISNGAFEDGLPPGWPPALWNATGDFFHWTNPDKAHTGSQYAYFGIEADGTTPLTNGSGSIEQSIPFIADMPPVTLSFWLWVTSDESSSSPSDHLYVEVLPDSGSLLATLADYSNLDKAGHWSKPVALSLYSTRPVSVLTFDTFQQGPVSDAERRY